MALAIAATFGQVVSAARILIQSPAIRHLRNSAGKEFAYSSKKHLLHVYANPITIKNVPPILELKY
jgi:hypothetical protein